MNAGAPPEERDFLEILEAQRIEYRKACRSKFDALRAAWDRAGRGDAEGLRELRRLAHTFAGSGPTFGFEALGEAARALEAIVDRIGSRHAAPAEAQRAEVERAIAALERTLPDPE